VQVRCVTVPPAYCMVSPDCHKVVAKDDQQHLEPVRVSSVCIGTKRRP
jgi:hypothetical protein